MRRWIPAFGFAGALGAASIPAAAQELLPPQPGLVITYRYSATKGTAPGNDTLRVIAVNGMRSTAEVERAGTPPTRHTLHSYRVWYSQRVIQSHGTLHQETPTGIVDQFAQLKPGMTRSFPSKIRFEPASQVPTMPNGQPNRAYAYDVDMSYAVERTERVSVPVGTFDSYVLNRTQSFTSADGRITRRDTTRIWFAPAVRWWVKIEFVSGATPNVVTTGVAIEIRQP